MTELNLSDTEIEILLFGKWRFNTKWEKISIEFKDDMTYEQTRIQTFILAKPRELLIGNKFSGLWYVTDKELCLRVKNLPKSFLNVQIPLVSKIDIGDIIASFASLFITEKYQILEIDSSKFLIRYDNESFAGRKLPNSKFSNSSRL
jgi:hypothetical protein